MEFLVEGACKILQIKKILIIPNCRKRLSEKRPNLDEVNINASLKKQTLVDSDLFNNSAIDLKFNTG